MLRTICAAVEKLWMFGDVPVEIAAAKIFSR